jgi:hypothetical protein
MTLCSEIVRQAYRVNNIVSINASLTANQLSEGMIYLNDVVGTTIGNEVGEKLNDWPIGNLGVSWPYGWNQVAWQYPRINSRLLYDVDSPQTIYLPFDPSDGSLMAVVPTNGVLAAYPLTLDGNGRLIDGAATLVIDNDAEAGKWIYRADLGNWLPYTSLAASDEMPFPSEFDSYFRMMVTLQLTPANSAAIDSATVESLKRAKRQISARYAQRVVTPADPSVLRLSEYDATGFNGNGPYGYGFGPNGWMG